MRKTPLPCLFAVASIFATVPSMLMAFEGQAFYYMQTNPSFSGDADGVIPVDWIAEIIEIHADGPPGPVVGFNLVTLDDIHALGLLSPWESEQAAKAEGTWGGGETYGRNWGSWANKGNRTPFLKTATCGSGTYRTGLPGSLAVDCETRCCSQLIWDPGWRSTWWWGVAQQKTWTYPANTVMTWYQQGWHSWYSGRNEYSTAFLNW